MKLNIWPDNQISINIVSEEIIGKWYNCFNIVLGQK